MSKLQQHINRTSPALLMDHISRPFSRDSNELITTVICLKVLLHQIVGSLLRSSSEVF